MSEPGLLRVTFVRHTHTRNKPNSDMMVWRKLCKQRRQWHPTPALLPGKSHGWRSLVGRSPWGHFHFSLSYIGEGNGNPLQCSCLESPRDGGAWWAAVYGVAQSRRQLKRLSSSSKGSPGGASGKEPTWQCRRLKKCKFDPWVGMISGRRKWQPTAVLLPGESHGQKSLEGYSPQGHKEADMTE